MSMLISACGAGVRPDPSPINVIDANYPTLEMFACGKTWHGVGVCRAKPAETVKLVIQGYFEGSIRIASPNCSISQSLSYADNAKIVVNIPPSQSQNCLIVATMSPRFPKGDNGVEVSSLRGFFALRRDSLPNQWVGRAVKLPSPGYGNLVLPVGPITSGRTTLHGCGRDYDQPNRIVNKKQTIRFQDFVNLGSPDECVADGNIFSDEYQTLLVNVMVVTYSSTIAPLPIPIATVQGGKLSLKADGAVSAVALDDLFKMGQSLSEKFDESKPHVVRAITAKGRTVLGIWSPSAKDFVWMQ